MTDNEQNVSKDQQTNTNEPLSRTIFSDEEVITIVKGFVMAYLRGLVRVNFVERDELLGLAEKKKEKMDHAQAVKEEIHFKKIFSDKIAIVSGTMKSTKTELDKAVRDLFYDILMYRSSKRIEGTFLEYKLEERLAELEKKLDATNNVVVQLVNWLTEEAKGQ